MDDAAETPREATDSAEAIAQSRTGGPTPPDDGGGERQPGEDELYAISQRVELAQATRPYERVAGDPLYRTLPVFAVDASAGAEDGRVVALKLPYEPLRPGPVGAILEVDATIADGPGVLVADLDHPHVLIAGGYAPSITNPRFHQQMVYAVATHTYGQFRTALGRQPAWGFDRRRDGDGNNRLVLRPFGAPGDPQAWYDREAGEVCFGYFKPRYGTPTVPPRDGSHVFLSLSQDIIVHEMTHALLDGLRPEFYVASHPDVAAFHEAFADLIAVFQRFSHEDVVTAALGRAKGDLSKAETLCSVGKEFGRATSRDQAPLRSLYAEIGALDLSAEDAPGGGLPEEPHERGRVLARAVFRAFAALYQQKAKRYVRLATGGTGILPEGEIPYELRRFLVQEIRRLALQFATICIRAIDYCPPVDIRFGDYLRALVTADLDLVPDDDWGYRAAVIAAFGAEGIYGEGTAFMTEEALAWLPPRVTVPPLRQLSFGETRFDGDPARPATAAELRKQAGAIGRRVTNPQFAGEFGLVSPLSEPFRSGAYDIPMVTSVRSARRVGPDMQVTFDTVAEVVQRRLVTVDGLTFPVLGGATVVVGPRGEVRYVIRKRVDHEGRTREQADYIRQAGKAFWPGDDTRRDPSPEGLRLMCAPAQSRG